MSAVEECCGGPSWRGRLCDYHQGYADATDTVADELDVARRRIAHLEAERAEMARAFTEPDVLAAYQATAAAVARRTEARP